MNRDGDKPGEGEEIENKGERSGKNEEHGQRMRDAWEKEKKGDGV